MRTSTPLPSLAFIAGILASACSGKPSGSSASTREAAAVSQAVAEPEMLTYAPDLHVAIDEMRRRPSGLWLQDLIAGTGDTVKAGMTVLVRYTGWLPDGTQFDSNEKLEPVRVHVGTGEVITGFDEGLTGMKPGGKRKLIVPPRLGYGADGIGPIPPNATLVFDVEVVSIEP